MLLSVRKLNAFLLWKLPSAWLCGVRVQELDAQQCTTGVTHRWINQNPFRSLYFAVQAMAAELSTGALVMNAVRESGHPISMLVVQNNSRFIKKATGRIRFVCLDGEQISQAIEKAVEAGVGQQLWMRSTGINADGEEVSYFEFQWSLKKRTESCP